MLPAIRIERYICFVWLGQTLSGEISTWRFRLGWIKYEHNALSMNRGENVKGAGMSDREAEPYITHMVYIGTHSMYIPTTCLPIPAYRYLPCALRTDTAVT